MSHPAAHIFLDAARHNQSEAHRSGNVVEFRPQEHLIVAGDLHGHRQNFVKILPHAALGADPSRMLVLQEIIHGGPADSQGGCRSCELLLRAARLKSQHPAQVHFLMGNHDVAQLTGNEITKEGCGVCKAFQDGVHTAFGADAGEVYAAIREFLRSLPLAARCPNGLVLSHSLPSPGRVSLFDPAVLNRPYEDEDFLRGHSVYELTWGRRQDETVLKEMATLLGGQLFVTGHQPQENGFSINAGRQLILASDHAHGVIAEFNADQPVEGDDLAHLVRPIVTL